MLVLSLSVVRLECSLHFSILILFIISHTVSGCKDSSFFVINKRLRHFLRAHRCATLLFIAVLAIHSLRLWAVGVELDGLLQVGHGSLFVAFEVAYAATLAVGPCSVRLLFDHFVEVGQGLV